MVVGVTCAAPVPPAAARCVKVGITPLPPPSPPQPRNSTDTRISPPSDCSTLILSVILRNLCSSAPNYTGSLNWTVLKAGREVVEPHPGRSSVLLGRTFALPSRHSVTSTIPSSNHLSPAKEASPAFLHLNIREIYFQSGRGVCKSENHEHKSKKEFRQRCKRRRRRGCLVCKSASDVFLALAVSHSIQSHSKTAPTVPCAAAIPGCMIPLLFP